jgi:hypothetical protein
MSLANKAVVIIEPPLESCHTELGRRLRATYEMLVAMKSSDAGIAISHTGILGLMPCESNY